MKIYYVDTWSHNSEVKYYTPYMEDEDNDRNTFYEHLLEEGISSWSALDFLDLHQLTIL